MYILQNKPTLNVEIVISNTSIFNSEVVHKRDLIKYTCNKDMEYSLWHDNGWIITSKPRIYEDIVLITSFKACHYKYGNVWSEDLNENIKSDNKDGMDNFLSFFPLKL